MRGEKLAGGCCKSLLQENWIADPASVVHELFSENWITCPACVSMSEQVFPAVGETHEWERALCAMEFVFLKILQIAHESCEDKEE